MERIRKPKLVEDPLNQERESEKILWTRWEIQLFLEQYFMRPKDFTKMASHFVNKNESQLVQFYFSFKLTFELKKYCFCVNFRNIGKLKVFKKKRAKFNNTIKNLSKKLIMKKLPLIVKNSKKSYFTIFEIREMACGQRGKPTKTHKKRLENWNKVYKKRNSEPKPALKINKEFFRDSVMSTYPNILSQF